MMFHVDHMTRRGGYVCRCFADYKAARDYAEPRRLTVRVQGDEVAGYVKAVGTNEVAWPMWVGRLGARPEYYPGSRYVGLSYDPGPFEVRKAASAV